MKIISSSTLEKGLAIPANAQYQVLETSKSPEDYQLLTATLNQLLGSGLDDEIIYKSIQDEH